MRERVLKIIEESKPKTVILASRWTLYKRNAVLKSIEATVADLKSRGGEEVIIIGPFPGWQPTLGKALAADMRKHRLKSPSLYTTTGFEEGLWSMDEMLRLAAQHAGATYISALNLSCEERHQCDAWVDEGSKTILTTYDGGHLTKERSIWFVQQIADSIFNPNFPLAPISNGSH